MARLVILACWKCDRPLTASEARWPRDYYGFEVIDGNDPICEPCETAAAEHAEARAFQSYWEGAESPNEEEIRLSRERGRS